MKSSQKGWVSRALTGNEEWQVGLLLLLYSQIPEWEVEQGKV
jgi:hypothetical protein